MHFIDSLTKLPPQELPRAGFVGGIFVTTWAFFVAVFAIYIGFRIWVRKPRTWPEFNTIFYGAAVLFLFYYILMLVDRWAHYEHARVVYGYIVLDPIAELARVTSTILLLWGTWSVLWKEHKNKYLPKAQAAWWLSANVAIFMVILPSLFYVALHLALAIVWLRFLNLNVIADVATKRNGFKIAMSIGYALLAAFLLVGATDNLRKAREVDGPGVSRKSRVPLWLATFFLAVRCLFELAINGTSASARYNPHTVRLVFDIGYGALTTLFLFSMAALSRKVASPSDKASHDANRVRANVRWCILNELEERTEGRRRASPELRRLLSEVKDDIPVLIQRGVISIGEKLPEQLALKFAQECVEDMLKEDLSLLAARQDPSQPPQHFNSGTSRDGFLGYFSKSSLRSAPSVLQKVSRASLVSNTSDSSAQSGGSRATEPRSVSAGSAPLYPEGDWNRRRHQPRHVSAGSAPRMPIHQEDVATDFGDRPLRARGVPVRTSSDATSQFPAAFPPETPRSWSPPHPSLREYTDSIQEQMSTPEDGQGIEIRLQPPVGPSYSQRVGQPSRYYPPGQRRHQRPVQGRRWQPGTPEQHNGAGEQVELAPVTSPTRPAQEVPPPPLAATPIYQPQPTPPSQSTRPGEVYTGPTIRPPVSSQPSTQFG